MGRSFGSASLNHGEEPGTCEAGSADKLLGRGKTLFIIFLGDCGTTGQHRTIVETLIGFSSGHS